MDTEIFDAANLLRSDIALAEYMSAALETGDAGFVARSLGVVARARGMTHVAEQAGLSRESLYRAMSEDGNPELGTVLRVLNALGLRLSTVPVEHAAA